MISFILRYNPALLIGLSLFVISDSSIVMGFNGDSSRGWPVVYIEKGDFIIGSTSKQVEKAFELCREFGCKRSWVEDEQPPRVVYLDSFWIDRFEVTVADYEKCVKAGECTLPGSFYNCNWQQAGRENHPINCVNWYQADSYCKWVGKRLPTEAEWERAARGANGGIYPWGNVYRFDAANYCDQLCEESRSDPSRSDGFPTTAPVGSFLAGASECGAMDLAGNVWEWTSDWYREDYYRDIGVSNPENDRPKIYKSVRGGGWNYWPGALRSSNREWDKPEIQDIGNGFRCVKEEK